MSNRALKLIAEAKRTRATRLNLSYCSLTELPSELFELFWLEELNLFNSIFFNNGGEANRFTSLDSNLKALKSLKRLSLNDSKQLSDLSPLKYLENLKVLDIKGSKISDLSPLEGLINLQELYLESNPITDISPLKSLFNLQKIDLAYTQLSDLSSLKDLLNLRVLYLNKTQISDLSPLKKLKDLQRLNITNTQVNDLSPLKNIIQKGVRIRSDRWDILNNDKGVSVADCPLSNPPMEIVEQGNNAILNYWRQINLSIIYDSLSMGKTLRIRNERISNKIDSIEVLKVIEKLTLNGLYKVIEENNLQDIDGTVELYEAKLIIVGEGATGKTTLYEKLKDPNHKVGNTDETHGINIYEGLEMRHTDIGDNVFYANLWDFGGQELQYMTHQFFLTPRAFYVLMMDARKESPNLSYWFKIISLLGKESQDGKEKVPLLLVFNKKAGSTGTPQYHDVLKYYTEHLETTFVEVDFGINDYRFDNLMATIKSKLVNLPIVKSKLPKQWKPIRQALREEGKPWITTARLDEICSQYRITEEKQQFLLSRYLHQLGSILHFQEDPHLLDTVILSPEWAVDGVYAILKDTKIRDEQNGRFSKADIFAILTTEDKTRRWQYKTADAQKILQLMAVNNFDICYPTTDNHYIAPQHLPDNAPPQYIWRKNAKNPALQFRLKYPMMPKGLMSRLIVRLSKHIENHENTDIVWKKGAILRIEKDNNPCRVLIKEDDAESPTGERQIIIEVVGDPTYRKYALQKVRDEVEELHKKWFRSIKADEIIPCCCEECRQTDAPESYLLKDLLKLRANAKLRQCNTGNMVPIQQLLEGIYDRDEIEGFDDRHRRM